MKQTEVRLLLAVIIIAVAIQGAVGYEENIREDIYLVRPDNEFILDTTIPTYLENEDLVFFACLETKDTPIRLSFVCLDTTEFEDIPAKKWGEQNCYMGSTNLEKFDCSNALVQADYIHEGENLKLEQQIRINKFSKTLNRIIETQFEDGGWETPLDTAYGVFVLSHYPDIFEERIEKALDYLKTNRNDEDKCWPADLCMVSTTANILFLLEKAEFEDLRIQHDGYIYLEKHQHFLEGENWSATVQDHALNVNNSIHTGCVWEYDGELTAWNLSSYPSIYNFTFKPGYQKHVGIACTENIVVNLYNQFNERLVQYQGDNFSYDVPPACWSLNNENITCDLRSTAFGINLPIVGAQQSAAKNYMSTLLVEDRTAGEHITNDWNTINDALYLHNTGDNDVITALLFLQNNSGSWMMRRDYYDKTYFEISNEEYNRLESEVTDQVSKDIVATGYAVMALLENNFKRDDEVIIDAERWVSLSEDEIGLNYSDKQLEDDDFVEEYKENRSFILNDTKRNSMAFYVLQHNARPVIVTRPRVLIMNQDETELDIINPTIFELEDLEYDLSKNLQNQISIEEKDYVGAYSFRRITLSLKKNIDSDDIGYLRILHGDNEYVKIPIVLETRPRLNITLPEELTVFGKTTVLPFTVTKSNHKFTCSLEWTTEGVSSSNPFNINNANKTTYNFPIRFAILETENTVYEGLITCTAGKVTFKIPIATNIIRFSNKPLRVTPAFISVIDHEQSPSVVVQNLLDQSIDVDITLATPDPYINLGETFLSLYPGEERNITIEIIPVEGDNYTASNTILFSTFNVEERVLLDIELPAPPPGMSTTALLIILAVILLIFMGLGYFAWTYRDALLEWYNAKFKQESVKKRVFREVAEMEAQEEREAIRNMTRILKLQGLKDGEVRARLEKEGYSPEDIDAALSDEEETQKE